MLDLGGYSGTILRVDLSRNKVFKTPLNRDLALNYIGGTGFCVKILYDETRPDTDALGPDNRLIMATGPLTGTFFPASARWNVAAKSPLGIWGESNVGGHFASELKFAGYDAIVFQGRSENPVYLWIDDDRVELRDASHLWGMSVWETDRTIRKDLGDNEVKVACIGPAGERLVYFAGIVTSLFRAAARSGMGTVMGSKGLKAVAVRGSKSVRVADPHGFYRIVKKYVRKIEKNAYFPSYRNYGTLQLIDSMNEIGRFPTKNHQSGVFPKYEKICADLFLERYKVRDRACGFCYVACKNLLKIKTGPHTGLCGDHPEYESVNSLGGRIWNDDPEKILYWNWLCDQYGLDTISTGAVISFVMELWEKHIITRDDTGGLDFSWGNAETIEKTIHMIARREGFGDLLAHGVRAAAERIGRGAIKYAMQVKGLEIPAQDGRAQKSMAIAHAASARGADHLRHCTFYDEAGNPEAIRRRWGEAYLPEMEDRLEAKYKGLMAKDCEDYGALMDSIPLCITGAPMFSPWFDDFAKIYAPLVGVKITPREMQKIGERIVEQRRAYNIRLGLSRKDDVLPARFLNEPAPDGPCKGQIVELKQMLDEYYLHRGYDLETGLIPRSRLEKLDLEYVADELERLGKLAKEKTSRKLGKAERKR